MLQTSKTNSSLKKFLLSKVYQGISLFILFPIVILGTGMIYFSSSKGNIENDEIEG